MPAHRRAEGVLPHAVGQQPVEVDIGKGELRGVGEAPRLGDQAAVLVDERMPVPCQVGGRFALAGGAVQVRRDAARRLVADELVAVAFLADHHVGRRQVGDHRRPGERREGRGRRGHPEVLADFHVQDQIAHFGSLKDQIGAERGRLPRQPYLALPCSPAGRELAAFVELAVVRQVGLRHHADQAALADERGAVVEQALHRHRQADERGQRKSARLLQELGERRLGAVDECLLVEKIVAGVGREPELGENGDDRLLARGFAHQLYRRVEVVLRIADAHRRRGHRHAGKSVAVQVEEVLHLAILAHRAIWYDKPYVAAAGNRGHARGNPRDRAA